MKRSVIYKYRAVLIAFIISITAYFSFRHIKESYWDRMVITSDGFGYYSYLPAIFIYDDLQYDFFESAYRKYLSERVPLARFYNYINEKKVNKYFAGVALMISPFFLTAHAVSCLLGYPADGYSDIYQLFVALAAIFYLGLGCFYCFKWMELYNISITIISFSLIVVVFGTNLFHYVVVEPSMSHVYSFAAIAAFIYFVKKYFMENNPTLFFKAAVCFGIILLIRPVNGIVLFPVPFLFGNEFSVKKLFHLFFRDKKVIFFSVLIVGAICFIQPLMYFLQCGKFLVWSYQGEKFDFMNPEIFNILFSYKKGWFVYTPVAFLSFVSFIYLFRKDKFATISLLAFFFIVTYILSCWWQWSYGGSFGMRVFIDYYAFLSFMICYSVLLLKSKIYRVIMVFLFLLSGILNQVQDYQYRKFILHWDSMDKDKYWEVFLKTDKEYEGILWK